jgi:hypothetical protein
MVLTYGRMRLLAESGAIIEAVSAPTDLTTEIGVAIAREVARYPDNPFLAAQLLEQSLMRIDYDNSLRVLGHDRMPTMKEVLDVQAHNGWRKPRGDCKVMALFNWEVAKAAGIESRILLDPAYGHAWVDVRVAGRWVSINGQPYSGTGAYVDTLPSLSRLWVKATDLIFPPLRAYAPTAPMLVPLSFFDELERRGERSTTGVLLGLYEPGGRRRAFQAHYDNMDPEAIAMLEKLQTITDNYANTTETIPRRRRGS